MLKMIFLLARRMFIRLLLVLLPLGLFMFLAQAIPLSPLQSLLLLVPGWPPRLRSSDSSHWSIRFQFRTVP